MNNPLPTRQVFRALGRYLGVGLLLFSYVSLFFYSFYLFGWLSLALLLVIVLVVVTKFYHPEVYK